MASVAEGSPRPLALPEGKVYIETPLEKAFSYLLQDRFGVVLSEPQVTQYGDLRRTTHPVDFEGSTVVFQYIRDDVFENDIAEVVKAYQKANPLDEVMSPAKQDSPSLHMQRTQEAAERILVAEELLLRHLSGNPVKDLALTNPEYYVPGVPLEQYPESFEFVLFRREEALGQHDTPSQIDSGKVDEKRADIHGVLYINARFADVPQEDTPPDRLYITDPLFEFAINRAAAIALDNETEDSLLDADLELRTRTYYDEGESKSRFVETSEFAPSEIMDDLGNYIYVLADSTRQ